VSVFRRGNRSFHRDRDGHRKNFYYFRKDLKEKGFRGMLSLLNPHAGIYKDLAAAIHGNRNPIADAKSGYTAVDMVLALYRSAKEERKIALPLCEDFTSEEMAGYFSSGK
jgi:predicted dehydrogenase